MILNLGEPNEKQRLFLLDQHKYIGYGGARGGGKSWAVRVKAVLLAVHYAGIKILIVRKTYKELDNNHIQPLRGLLRKFAKYNDSKKRFTFPNGSTISFGYFATEKDADLYQGAEYDCIFIDEATNLDELWIKKILPCCRGVNTFPKRVYFTCNPGGRGHHYIKRLFIDRKYVSGEDPADYAFIQALPQDNKALMESQPDYIKQLEALPEKIRKAWLYGDWNIFSGQFFEEFKNDPEHYEDRKYTHVIEPFEIPSGWNIYRSFDFGYASPFSCAWWAIDYEGRAYRILELYGCTGEPNEGVKWTPDQIFQKIRNIETSHRWLKGKHVIGVADPSIWDGSRGESIADTSMKHQVYWEPGDNTRIPGWMQVRYRFMFDEEGFPMMYIFKSCKGFIRTIPTLIYDERKVEDLDTTMEDHIADETRYFCMAHPITPKVAEERKPVLDDPLNLSGKNTKYKRYASVHIR